MGLVLEWNNLRLVLLPFLGALTVAALLAIPLRRAAERSGMPRLREPCIGCRAEAGLLRRGYCSESCAVNGGPGLPLLVFVATATTALFALLDPADFTGFVLPFGLNGPGILDLTVGLLIGVNAAAALLLAAYFLQDRPEHRALFLRGAIVVSLGALAVTGLTTGTLSPWLALATPLALTAVILSAGVEWRARHGRPAFGLRTVGVATGPLFLVMLFALVRIVQVVEMASGS